MTSSSRALSAHCFVLLLCVLIGLPHAQAQGSDFAASSAVDSYHNLHAPEDTEETPSRITEISGRAVAAPFRASRVERMVPARIRHEVRGQVTDAETGESLPGVNVVVQGTTTGTITGPEGEYELTAPSGDAVLIFSFVGYLRQEVPIEQREEINVALQVDVAGLEELVVVGYGVQQRSDITGSVASVPSERLEALPYQNISQVIQGAVPGVMVQTTSAGAAPSSVLMVRGRNSIAADNSPLVVVDGVPYSGNLRDINTNDIESIEVLKDASAAAIYGARGSNGVILVTTSGGSVGDPSISYRGSLSMQQFANLPEMMDGEEFYHYKLERFPGAMTSSEREIYESGEWVDWLDLGTRTGTTHEHNLSVSGGFGNTTYYLSGSLFDVDGIVVNDSYRRLAGRVNLDTEVAEWLSLGTRTQLSHGDRSGVSPQLSGGRGLFRMNPLTRPYDENGNFTVYPWVDDSYFANPLASTTFDNVDQTLQVVTNNFALVEVPFVHGLRYRLNTGVTLRNTESATYRGRNTREGLQSGGSANMGTSRTQNITLENILSFDRNVGSHHISATGVASYEGNTYRAESVSAIGFPNDIISWYALDQSDFISPSTSFNESRLLSQMLRLNYTYDNRYLLTATARRDGFSGFGIDNKWGVFPSLALGWNAHNEDFFPWTNLFSELKPRVSWGINGNHAVGTFQSMSRMQARNMIYGNVAAPGYIPSQLANENLGWESSRTLNVGLDIGIFGDRITGDINAYRTHTSDLLLQRTISSVHGITSVLENIGQTRNMGVDVSITSRNIVASNFGWTTTGNMSFNRNEILDLYGDGRDDVANSWFIGHPINVNYDYVVDGVWQLDEADEAAEWGSEPGFVKLRDVTGDGRLGPDDRQIIGQQDPRLMWGMNNSFSYGNFEVNVFMHGVHGVTRYNMWLSDDTWADVRINTTRKNWWTPDNPSNDWIRNHLIADYMAGIQANWYEDASFIRIKDITLSYDLPQSLNEQIGVNRLRLYATGTNLYTFTQWSGLDPELSSQQSYPLQRDFVIGLNVQL